MEFKCKHCNPNHDFLTAKKLSRHENTPSHKRKFDPEFAAAEEVQKVAAKKIRNEKQIAIKAGEKETARKAGATASQKRKVDSEFAAAEEFEKAAAKRTRNEKETERKAGAKETERKAGAKETERKAGAKETERKAGAKETARKAARNQGEANENRDQSKAHQQVAQKRLSRAQHKKATEEDPAPWIIGTGTEEDALKALVRYHGSTNVAMLLHTDDIRMKKNIYKFVHVSPEAKAAIRKTWQEGEMAINRAHFSCATCGIRDNGNYAEMNVADLPDFLNFIRKITSCLTFLKVWCLFHYFLHPSSLQLNHRWC